MEVGFEYVTDMEEKKIFKKKKVNHKNHAEAEKSRVKCGKPGRNVYFCVYTLKICNLRGML
jgi:hypothetical protein